MTAAETTVILDEPAEKATSEVVIEAGRFRYRLRVRHRVGAPIATPVEAQAIAAALVAELTKDRPA